MKNYPRNQLEITQRKKLCRGRLGTEQDTKPFKFLNFGFKLCLEILNVILQTIKELLQNKSIRFFIRTSNSELAKKICS